MVNRSLWLPVMTGNLLMILSGEFTVWFFILFERIMDSHNVSMFFIIEMIGKIIGAITFPLLADLIGRKYSLLIMTLPAVVSVVLCELFYRNYALFCISRICSGLVMGGSLAVLPIYIGEISEAKFRGGFIASAYLFCNVGIILVTSLAGITYYAGSILNLFAIVLAIVFVITFALVAPETPYYYLRKERHNVAKTILDKLRTHITNTDIELNEMQGQVNETGQNADEYDRVMACLQGPGWVKSGIMMFGILVSQLVIAAGQTETVIMSYMYQNFYPQFILGAACVLSACVCTATVDKIGRKLLMMISYGGIAVSTAIFLILNTLLPDNAFAILVPVIMFTASHNSLLILQMILLAELFPLRIKMISSALCTALFLGSGLVTNVLSHLMGSVIYFPILFISIGMLPLVQFFYLETKGKSLQEIQLILNKK